MKDKAKYLLILIPIVILVVLAVFLIFRHFRQTDKNKPQDITLTYWGLFEPAEVVNPLIEEYQKLFEEKNPGSTIQINYERRYFDSLKQYRETVLTRLDKGDGPDIVRLHATWLPQFSKELSAMPSSVMTLEQYNNTFYRVAANQATIKGQVYAIPLMYEGLVLLANVDLFNEAGLAVPKVGDKLTWFEFTELAKALTKRSGSRMTQAGAAIGLSRNIPHASDILGLMMAQVGVDSLDELSPSSSAADALDLYGKFYREDKVWDESFLSSLDAFISGQVAMIFVPSWRILDIEEKNPGINMETTAVPQTPNTTDQTVNWSSFWMEGVSLDSKYPDVAWDFLKFLSERESQLTSYSLATQLRSFGEPYSRVDLAENLSSHKFLGALMAGAPTATSWFITDASGNDVFTELISAAIDRVAAGADGAIQLKLTQETMKKVASEEKVLP